LGYRRKHKLASVDVAFALKVINPPGRGKVGRIALKLNKDRDGHLRELERDGRVAMMSLTSDGDNVQIEFDPPGESSEVFRPTGIMERISRVIEDEPGIGKRDLRARVAGKATHVDRALGLLISEGHVRPEPDGRAVRHHSVRPFREAENATAVLDYTANEEALLPEGAFDG
jgi:superfamily II helicase